MDDNGSDLLSFRCFTPVGDVLVGVFTFLIKLFYYWIFAMVLYWTGVILLRQYLYTEFGV